LDDKVLTNLVYQLVNQGVLDRTADERPVVSLNDESVAVMKGDRVVRFVEPRVGAVRKSRAAEVSWEGVDRDLFEHLRELRKAIAAEREVPAFVIFGDRTLRSMARIRPADMANMKRVHGIGETKLQDLGGRFAQAIAEFCAARGMSTNEAAEALGDEIVRPRTMRPAAANPQRGMAYGMFERGEPMERIARTIGRAESTVGRYLEQFIEERRIEDVSRWVDAATYATVAAAIDELGMDSLKPVFEKLGQRVPYEQIRVVAAHLRMRSAM
jgi:ATP-dependent DNA helicase RecQ